MSTTLTSGYDNKTTSLFRLMTIEEMKALQYGQYAKVCGYKKGVGAIWRTVKVNGAPKTWKRDPLKVKVPLKYGLYECWRQGYEGAFNSGCLVVEVKA